jgi:hypothetical protein
VLGGRAQVVFYPAFVSVSIHFSCDPLAQSSSCGSRSSARRRARGRLPLLHSPVSARGWPSLAPPTNRRAARLAHTAGGLPCSAHHANERARTAAP